MATIKESERLLKRVTLLNIMMSDKDSFITPLLSGGHGIGKTTIAKQFAKDINGAALVIEGGSLKEGEITGLPFAQKNENGETNFIFIPYKDTAAVQRLEKYYYDKAMTTGFLNGTVKLTADGDTTYVENGKTIVLSKERKELDILYGKLDINKYSFGENLPGEIKLKLIKEKEITPVIILIDEMNRTDQQTMKEFMNMVLTKKINEYQFPWWVQFVAAVNPASSDSQYSVNELDAAQLDRFLRINVVASLKDWQEYAIEKGFDDEYIQAVDSTKLLYSAKSNFDEIDMESSPRSHEICSYIWKYRYAFDDSGFLSPEDIKNDEQDAYTLIRGKIGKTAGSEVISKLNNLDKVIPITDILTGTSTKINSTVAEKIKNSETLYQNIIMKHSLDAISTVFGKYYFEKDSNETSKEKWENVLSQLKELISLVSASNRIYFARNCIKAKFNIPEYEDKYKTKDIRPYQVIAHIFSKDILKQIFELEKNVSLAAKQQD